MSDHQNEVPSLLSDPQLPKKNNKTLKVGMTLAIMAIALLVYFIQDEQQQNLLKEEALTAAFLQLDSLSNELDKRILTISKLGGEIDTLVGIKQKLEEEKKYFLNRDQRQKIKLGTLRDKVEGYRQLLLIKDEEINQLTQINEQLTTENIELKNETQVLNQSINNIKLEKKDLNQKVQLLSRLKIEDFIIEHEGFEENEAGEITPINIKEINKKIRFFVEERYPEIVEYTRNIIWDSYKTFLSPSDIYHFHTFIAQVKVNDLERLKYVEVIYNPFVKKVKGDFEWIAEDEEFYLVDEKEEKKDNAADLIELGISNQEQKPGLENFVSEHQGFLDVMEQKNLKDSEIVPVNVKEINKSIRAFVKSSYSNVEYTRNIIWDSYTSFISPFDKFHHHNFVAQVKVKDVKRLKYLEVFYNPKTEKVTSDFVWIESDEEFFRVKESEE